MATLQELLVRIGVDADDLDKGLDKSSKQADEAFDRIGGAVDRLATRTTVASAGIGAAMVGLPAVGALAGAGLAVGFGGAIAGVGLAAAAQSQRVKDSFAGLREDVGAELRDMAAPLEDTLLNVSDDLRGTFDALAPDLRQSFADMAPVLTDLSNSVLGAFESWGPVIDGATGVFNEIVGQLADGLGPQIEQLGANLADLFASMKGNTGLFTGIVNGAFSLVNALIQTLTWLNQNEAALHSLAMVFGVVAAAIIAARVALAVYNTIMMVVRAATLVWTGIQWLLNASMYGFPLVWIIAAIIALIAIVVAIIVYWDELVAATVAAWEWIKTALAAAWAWIATTAAAVWGAIKAFFVGLWNGIVAFITGVVSGIVSWLANAWASVKATAIAAWNALKAGVMAIMQAHVAWVMGKVTAVKNFIHQGFNAAKNLAIAAFQAMRARIVSTISALMSAIRAIPGKIRSALSGAGSWLINTGRDIIQGLIDGVTGMIGSLRDKFSQITSMIPDWKGPRLVDLHLLEPAGQDLMTGLEHGITTGAAGVRATLTGITASIPSAVGGAGRGVAGPGETRVVFDVTGANEDWKRIIRKMVRIEGRGSVQAAFGTGVA